MEKNASPGKVAKFEVPIYARMFVYKFVHKYN